MQDDVDGLFWATCDVGGRQNKAIACDDDSTALCAAMLQVDGHQIYFIGYLGLLLLQRNQFRLVAWFITAQDAIESGFEVYGRQTNRAIRFSELDLREGRAQG